MDNLVEIIYKGETVLTVPSGKTVALHTEKKKFTEDLLIKANAVPETGGGDISINGIIREYEVNAGASVSAGDFVEFVTRYGNGQFSDTSCTYISACKLGDSKVLIAYQDIGNSNYGTAIVLSIAGSTISIGTPTVFNSSSTDYISVCALSDSKVLVAYADGGNSSYGTAQTLIVDDTTITAGTKSLFNASGSTIHIQLSSLTDSKIIVIYTYSTRVYSKILTIADTTITAGTAKQLSTENGQHAKGIVALGESKALALYFDNYLFAVVLTISGTTITKGTEVNVGKSVYTEHFDRVVSLTDSKVLIIYKASNTGIARILTIADTTITAGTAITFNNAITDKISVCALSDSKVLVAYADGGNSSYGTAQTLIVDDTTITAGEKTVFDYNTITYSSLVAFSDNAALVVYDNALGMYSSLSIDGAIITANDNEEGTYVQPATSNLHNVGVAKTSGAEGEMVEVYCAV